MPPGSNILKEEDLFQKSNQQKVVESPILEEKNESRFSRFFSLDDQNSQQQQQQNSQHQQNLQQHQNSQQQQQQQQNYQKPPQPTILNAIFQSVDQSSLPTMPSVVIGEPQITKQQSNSPQNQQINPQHHQNQQNQQHHQNQKNQHQKNQKKIKKIHLRDSLNQTELQLIFKVC